MTPGLLVKVYLVNSTSIKIMGIFIDVYANAK